MHIFSWINKDAKASTTVVSVICSYFKSWILWLTILPTLNIKLKMGKWEFPWGLVVRIAGFTAMWPRFIPLLGNWDPFGCKAQPKKRGGKKPWSLKLNIKCQLLNLHYFSSFWILINKDKKDLTLTSNVICLNPEEIKYSDIVQYFYKKFHKWQK